MKNYTGAYADALYTFLLENIGNSYSRQELIEACRHQMPEDANLESSFKKAMKIVKVLATTDGHIIPTPGHYTGNQYLVALPHQAELVHQSAIQSGLTAAGNESVHSTEIGWLEKHVNDLPLSEKPLAKGMIKNYKASMEFARSQYKSCLEINLGVQRAKREEAKLLGAGS